MDKLQVLLIMLVAAVAGLAVSIYLLALSLAPNESPLSVLAQVLTGGFSPTLPFIIPLSSLLFLSTVLASMVGVIYFLVVPEMKNYASGSGKETTSIVLRTLRPDERKVVSVIDAHGGTTSRSTSPRRPACRGLRLTGSSPHSRSVESCSSKRRETPTRSPS